MWPCREVFAERPEDLVAFVIRGREEHERVTVGNTGPDSAPEVRGEDLVQVGVQDPCGTDCARCVGWGAESEAAVCGADARHFVDAGLPKVGDGLLMEIRL